MCAGVLDEVRVFRMRCWCSGVVEGVLGVWASVLEKVRMFWIRCGCSGVVAGVLDKVQVF